MLDHLRQQSPLLALQNRVLHQVGQRLLLGRCRFLDGQCLDPFPGAFRPFGVRDPFQYVIEQGIARRCAIDHHQSFEVGVDSVGKPQLHQHGTGQSEFKRMLADGQENSFLIVEQKQHHLFRKSQHAADRADGQSGCNERGVGA